MSLTPGQSLTNAAASGNAKLVAELLKNSATILWVNCVGNSALHTAFINKHEKVVDLILKAIYSTSKFNNLQNPMGLTHLHIACTRKNEQIVQGFLDAGAKIDDTINRYSALWTGFNALHFAASFQSLQAMKVLLRAGMDPDIKTSTGKTASEIIYESLCDPLIMVDLLEEKKIFGKRNFSNFQIACLNENAKLVKKFIDHGAAKMNSQTIHELSIAPLSSPLHCAVTSGSKEKIQLLLQNGAQIECTNSKKMTPLHQALYMEHSTTYRSHNGPGIVRRQYDDEIVKILYESVKDKMVSHEDLNGLSFFHAAILRNDLPTVKKYLNEGKVDVNKPMPKNAGKWSNGTPLHMTVQLNYLELAELLIEHGADVNSTTNHVVNMTPLHMAFKFRYQKFIELLLMNGAKLDVVEPREQNTMLHYIVQFINYPYSLRIENLLDNESIVMYTEQLVKLGVDLNAKNKKGDTALHCFVHSPGNIWDSYFQMLLDLGADINVKNNEGKLPYKVTEMQLKDSNKINAIFYHHVQKLKALDLKVDPENDETCKLIVEKGNCFGNEELMCREQQRLDEIAKLKNIKIGDATSLYNFIKLDSQRTNLYAECQILNNIAKDVDLKKKFPSYAYLIKLKYRTATGFYSNSAKKRLHGDFDRETVNKKQCFE